MLKSYIFTNDKYIPDTLHFPCFYVVALRVHWFLLTRSQILLYLLIACLLSLFLNYAILSLLNVYVCQYPYISTFKSIIKS